MATKTKLAVVADPPDEPQPDLPWVTTSERRAFKRCPWRWAAEYREGLRSKEISDKLWFGIGIHEALASYYKPGRKRGRDFVDVWRTFVDEDEISRAVRTRPTGDFDESEWVNARALGEAMLIGHHEHWGGDKNWDVVYAEEPFQIIIPHPTNRGEDVAIFTSTFDGVVRDKDDGKMKLLEHKTAASVTLGHLPMDDQGGAYWAVATNVLRSKGVLGPKERIHGIVYNFLRKSLPDDRPKDSEGYATNKPAKEHYLAALTRAGVAETRQAMKLSELEQLAKDYGVKVVGERSKVQPPPLFVRETVWRIPKERATQIKRIGSEVLVMNKFRDGELPLYKTPTRDCSWDCPVYNLCELDEQQQDTEEFKEAVFHVADPYDRYRLRKSAAEGV